MPVTVKDIYFAEFSGVQTVLDMCQRLKLIAKNDNGPSSNIISVFGGDEPEDKRVPKPPKKTK